MSIASAELRTGFGGVMLIVTDDAGGKTFMPSTMATSGGGQAALEYRAWVIGGGVTTHTNEVTPSILHDVIGGEDSPADSIGSDGTYMIDEAHKLIWGPKASGTWLGTSRTFMTIATANVVGAVKPGDYMQVDNDGALTPVVGTEAGSLAAGNDSRITGAQSSSGLGSAVSALISGSQSTYRSALGLGTAATAATSDFASAAQGALAATAVQPAGIAAAISANLAAVKTALGLL